MSEPNLYKIDSDLRNLTENVRRGQEATETALREQRAETAAYREKQIECLNKLTDLTGKLAVSMEKFNAVKHEVDKTSDDVKQLRGEVDSVKGLIVKVSVGAGGGVAVVSEIVSKLFL